MRRPDKSVQRCPGDLRSGPLRRRPPACAIIRPVRRWGRSAMARRRPSWRGPPRQYRRTIGEDDVQRWRAVADLELERTCGWAAWPKARAELGLPRWPRIERVAGANDYELIQPLEEMGELETAAGEGGRGGVSMLRRVRALDEKLFRTASSALDRQDRPAARAGRCWRAARAAPSAETGARRAGCSTKGWGCFGAHPGPRDGTTRRVAGGERPLALADGDRPRARADLCRRGDAAGSPQGTRAPPTPARPGNWLLGSSPAAPRGGKSSRSFHLVLRDSGVTDWIGWEAGDAG